MNVVLGDARLTLAGAAPRQYGLLVLDAFSSDAIPRHLLTREAVELYLEKLADAGVLAFNISYRYVNLQPVLGRLAQVLRLACLTRLDVDLRDTDKYGQTGG